jgi:hypothetical protein
LIYYYRKVFLSCILINVVSKQFFSLLRLVKQEKLCLNEYRHEFIWILSQIVIFFFENSEFYFKYESFKPLEAIFLLYHLINNNNQSKVNFIIEIHEFLAKLVHFSFNFFNQF